MGYKARQRGALSPSPLHGERAGVRGGPRDQILIVQASGAED